MSGNLIVKVGLPGRGGKPIAVLVGKNVLSLAAKRNLLKRRIRAILAPLTKGTDLRFTIIARPSSASASFKEIKEEILDQIRKNKK